MNDTAFPLGPIKRAYRTDQQKIDKMREMMTRNAKKLGVNPNHFGYDLSKDEDMLDAHSDFKKYERDQQPALGILESKKTRIK